MKVPSQSLHPFHTLAGTAKKRKTIFLLQYRVPTISYTFSIYAFILILRHFNFIYCVVLLNLIPPSGVGTASDCSKFLLIKFLDRYIKARCIYSLSERDRWPRAWKILILHISIIISKRLYRECHAIKCKVCFSVEVIHTLTRCRSHPALRSAKPRPRPVTPGGRVSRMDREQ